jgi:prevent-host-death family protein
MKRNRNSVGAYEAKTRFSELLGRVESGREITITRHGVPVARLVPAKREIAAEERLAAVRRIQKLGAGLSLRGLKIKDLVSAGRR